MVADKLYLAGEGVDVCFSLGLKQCFFGVMAGIALPKQVASVVFDKFD